ncbi:acyl dehydratase [Paramagnetospirillum kuznetsovii]|uniref:Acyl dehydratase n=1 Tax=Paramagnetospirillum kuznetsovii TaxID=2053833 RepID=A0A364NWM3_9PROT|nr:MaoC family dehydratase [Paramagnetospirillum kuznetsovii]RAU21380.1 acyl dehydratase [Paramagnetospirillum kuznetsovii]
MTFKSTIDDRYFEDYVKGAIHEFGRYEVTEAEVIDFASRYDPQDFHTDPQAAAKTVFGGVIASGWHTCGMMMRMYADHYLTKVASLASPGLDALRWIMPVRPGDVLSVRVTIEEAVPSKSKPDRGVVTSFIETLNQNGQVVMSMRAVNMVARRR